MYKIKQLPEDFIVNEISSVKAENGFYSYYNLKKTNYTTVGALELLSRKLGMPLKNFDLQATRTRTQLQSRKYQSTKAEKILKMKNSAELN